MHSSPISTNTTENLSTIVSIAHNFLTAACCFKHSSDITYLPSIISASYHIMAHTTAHKILFDREFSWFCNFWNGCARTRHVRSFPSSWPYLDYICTWYFGTTTVYISTSTSMPTETNKSPCQNPSERYNMRQILITHPHELLHLFQTYPSSYDQNPMRKLLLQQTYGFKQIDPWTSSDL